MNESKTPLTDAAINRAGPRGFVDVEFARDLEIQLASANENLSACANANNEFRDIAHKNKTERDQLAARVMELEKALQSAAESCPPKSFMTAPDCFTEKCGHNSYWRTHYGNCMACRAEAAERKANALDRLMAWNCEGHPFKSLEAIEAAIAKEK